MCCHHNHALPYIYLFLCELRDMNAVDWYTLLSRDVIYMVHRKRWVKWGRTLALQISWVQILAPLLTSCVTCSDTLPELSDP